MDIRDVERSQPARLDRRRFLVLATAGVGGIGLLAACTGAPVTPTAAPVPTAAPRTAAPAASAAPAAASSPVASSGPAAAAASPAAAAGGPRGTLRVGLVGIGPDLSPLWGPQFIYYSWALFDTLVTLQTPDGQPAPMLATYKNIDPLTWQFDLRKDVKFWDGTPLTSDDVVFSLEKGHDPKLAIGTVVSDINTITSATNPDPYTVIVKTKAADPVLPNRISLVGIFSKAAFTAAASPADFNRKPMGSGQFKPTNFQPNQTLEVVANDTYWGGRPTLAGIKFSANTDSGARMQAYRAGDLDVNMSIVADQAAQAKQIGQVLNFKAQVENMIYFDIHTPQLKDKRVRTALNMAVDLPKIVKALFGDYTEPAHGQPANPLIFGYDPSIPAYPYDPAQAKQLLAQAGFPDGFTMEMTYGNYLQVFADAAQAIAPYFQAIGVNTPLKTFSGAEFGKGWFNNTLGPMVETVMSAGEISDPAQPYARFTSSTTTGGTGRFENPAFDKLFDQSQQELDRTKRQKLFQQMNQLLHDDPPGVPLWTFFSLVGASNKVGNFKLAGSSVPVWMGMTRSA